MELYGICQEKQLRIHYVPLNDRTLWATLLVKYYVVIKNMLTHTVGLVFEELEACRKEQLCS